jgi:DNA polymerase
MRDEYYGINFRHLFKAPVGYTFVITDSSQIEPRCLDWVAGDTESLAMLRDGWNPYEAFARSLGWDFAKGTLKASNKLGYAMSKGMRLGLGYRMGEDNFVKSAPILTNGDYRPTLIESRKAVRLFREQKRLIVQLWEQFDTLFRENVGTTLDVETPSGGVMQYYNIRRGRFGIEAQVVRGGIWWPIHGGVAVENLIQRIAREVFANIYLGLIDAGLDVRLHVHDEAITLCKKEDAHRVKETQEAIFKTPPVWMADLPLACETVISEVYCK